jgi:FkbM family methyltransferase
MHVMTRELLRKAWRSIDARQHLSEARRIRSRRLQFYGRFISDGDLVFDVGANIGERSDVFLALGAVVVAIEPQAECAKRLRSQWQSEPRFTLFEGACSEAAGERELFISDANTLSSMSPEWIEAVRASGRFRDYRWDKTHTVETTTLDALIAEHGTPAFIKVDVEGLSTESCLASRSLWHVHRLSGLASRCRLRHAVSTG